MQTKLRIFFVMLYMAIWVNALAQQPVFYGVTPVGFGKYDYKIDLAEAVKVPDCIDCFSYSLEQPSTDNLSAFDIFNGRYFSIGGGKGNPIYISEIDVPSGKIKKHPIKQSPQAISYNPKNNSILYVYRLATGKQILAEIFLSDGSARERMQFQESVNSTHEGFVFNWKTQEIASVYWRYNNVNKQIYYCQIANIETGVLNTIMLQKGSGNMVWDVVKNKLLITWHIGYQGYLSSIPSFGADTFQNKIFFFKFNAFVPHNSELICRPDYYKPYTFVLNSQNRIDTFINQRFPQLAQLHTFEQPYIYVSGNASYTSTYGKSYTWLWNDKPIENSNSQDWKPTKCGSYKVVVTHLDGRVDTSEAVNYTKTDADGNEITSTSSFAYPNPFSDMLNIRYKTCTDEPVIIKIYNLLGAEIFQSDLGNVEAGEHIYNWNSTAYGLRYGLYFVRVYSGNELVSTQKVVKSQ